MLLLLLTVDIVVFVILYSYFSVFLLRFLFVLITQSSAGGAYLHVISTLRLG